MKPTEQETLKKKIITSLIETYHSTYEVTADSILSLILSEIDKAGLTDEQLSKIRIESQNSDWAKDIAAAQLGAIKKQLRG